MEESGAHARPGPITRSAGRAPTAPPSQQDVDALSEEIQYLSQILEEEINQLASRMHSTPQQSSPTVEPVGRKPPWKAASPSPPPASQDLKEIFHQVLDEARAQSRVMFDQINLPKPELLCFDGDPLKYYPFMRSFDNVVDAKTNDDSAKLNLLIQYCSTSVKKVLQCCLVKEPSEGYRLARTLLEQRFGNKDYITHTWIDKIMNKSKVNVSDLLEYADELRSCQETLISLDCLCELENSRSLFQIIDKLPHFLQTRWLKYNCKIRDSGRRPLLNDIIEFISQVSREVNDPVFGKVSTSSAPSRKTMPPSGKVNGKHKQCFSSDYKTCNGKSNPHIDKEKVRYTSQSSSPRQPPTPVNSRVNPNNGISLKSCPYCRASHDITQCDGFKTLRVKDRIAFVHTKGLCVNCFQYGHYGRDCPKHFTCNINGCGQRHNRFLHLPGSHVPNSSGRPSTNPNVTTSFVRGRVEKVALPIVATRVRAPDSSAFVDTYALIDTGGTGAFCTDELATLLGVRRNKGTFHMTTVTQKDVPTEADVVNLRVSDLNDNHCFNLPHVLVQSSLNIGLDNLADQDMLRSWPHLADIRLPQRLTDVTNVQLIIGQNTPELLCPLDTRLGGPGEPFACLTALGWVINGPLQSGSIYYAHSNYVMADPNIHSNIVNQLWQLEDSETDKLEMSHNDRLVLETWDKSIDHLDGRYSLCIPFKAKPPSFPNNRPMAEHRLRLLGKRLLKDSKLKLKYTEEIRKLLDNRYAEVVGPDQLHRDDGMVWYLPHHPVVNPHKPEKPRLVFDCAAKCAGMSLNDIVHQGPDLTNNLLGVLLRFRLENVAFMADIEAMFLQVHVHPEDRDVLRFLWWKNDDPSDETIVLRMRSHLFGGVWSPSCVNYALHRTVEDNRDDFVLEAQQTVYDNFYVDDCLKSVPTTEQAIVVAHEVQNLLRRGGFNLTKWVSNSRTLLSSFPEDELASGLHSLDMNLDDLPSERALGLLWNVEKDCFQFDNKIVEKPLSRRGILSVVSSVFDPMGFVSPFILVGKRLFQELCRLKLGWDDPIPPDIAASWGRWLEDLPLLTDFRIPRCIRGVDVSAQLHHFADASEYAYGAVSYLRLVTPEGEVKCSFVMSKARLSPIKPMTIPRLELAAAVEAVKLDRILHRELKVPLEDSVFWSDSTIVLWYLQNDEQRFQTYVANRVAYIRGSTSPHQWRHVPGELNPADDASRGLSASDLLRADRWKCGPEFLHDNPEVWPKQPVFDCKTLEGQAEVKKVSPIYNTIVEEDIVGDLFRRYSSWFRLKRAVAWLLRFKGYLCGKLVTGPLELDELQKAEQAIVVHTQRSISQSQPSLKKLVPVHNDQGILCVGGRFKNSKLPEQHRHPWILPRDHHITTLIIQHYHALVGHAGTERVLAETRNKYWIIRGRVAVKKVTRMCLTCRRLWAKPEIQIMSDLPADRLERTYPFAHVGVDIFGPFVVKRGRSELKRYGCIFSCLVTRAIHIEVTHSLTTDSFINALQRFIARRGKPALIRCDNGSNFVGAEAELKKSIKELSQSNIGRFLHEREINWIFNTPAASHMGGVWERQIRTVRNTLRGVMRQQTLDDEALHTVMCLVESIVNSRPITRVSDDPKDLMALTPNHLLLLRGGSPEPYGVFCERDVYRKRWRQVQYLADLFWRRWLSEYLPSLQARQKWLVPRRNLSEGDLVLVLSETSPRSQWPLGRITKTYPSADSMVRSVQIRTQTGLYDRPIHKLCLLEGS